MLQRFMVWALFGSCAYLLGMALVVTVGAVATRVLSRGVTQDEDQSSVFAALPRAPLLGRLWGHVVEIGTVALHLVLRALRVLRLLPQVERWLIADGVSPLI